MAGDGPRATAHATPPRNTPSGDVRRVLANIEIPWSFRSLPSLASALLLASPPRQPAARSHTIGHTSKIQRYDHDTNQHEQASTLHCPLLGEHVMKSEPCTHNTGF